MSLSGSLARAFRGSFRASAHRRRHARDETQPEPIGRTPGADRWGNACSRRRCGRVATTSASSTHPTAGVTLHDAPQHVSAGGPRLVHGAVADVLVRVRGGAVCSGTPITGTVYVVTAAHCVLDRRGNAAARTVVRDEVTYSATAVLVDDRYFDELKVQFDAAVLVMDQVVPGPSASIGAALPTTGSTTIAGFQPLDTDGTLLRGSGPYDVPSPRERPAISSRSNRLRLVAPYRPRRWQSPSAASTSPAD